MEYNHVSNPLNLRPGATGAVFHDFLFFFHIFLARSMETTHCTSRGSTLHVHFSARLYFFVRARFHFFHSSCRCVMLGFFFRVFLVKGKRK